MKIGWIAALVTTALVALLLIWRGPSVDAGRSAPPLPAHREDAARGDAAEPLQRATTSRSNGSAAARLRAGDPADDGGGARPGAGEPAAKAPEPPHPETKGGAARGGAVGETAKQPPAAPPSRAVSPPQPADANARPAEDGDESPAEPIYETAFDGGGERAFPTDSQEQVETRKMPGSAGSIQFWFRPEWDTGNQDSATLVQLGDSGMELVKDGDALRFRFHDNAGDDNSVDAYVADWAPQQWRFVTATWLGPQLNFYVDGQLVSQNSFATGPDLQAVTKIYIGSAFPSGEAAARSSILGLRVMNRDFTASEIDGMFHAWRPPTGAGSDAP